MKEKRMDCRNCGPSYHAMLGFIPERVINPEVQNSWINVAVCTACGNLQTITPEPEQIENAEQMYLDLLVRNEIIDSDERDRVL